MSLTIIDTYRDELFSEEQTHKAKISKASKARAKSGRRRKVDPCTSDLDYSDAQREFMMAMHDYIRSSGRKFPTHSEYLEVLISLGYHK